MRDIEKGERKENRRRLEIENTDWSSHKVQKRLKSRLGDIRANLSSAPPSSVDDTP